MRSGAVCNHAVCSVCVLVPWDTNLWPQSKQHALPMQLNPRRLIQTGPPSRHLGTFTQKLPSLRVHLIIKTRLQSWNFFHPGIQSTLVTSLQGGKPAKMPTCRGLRGHPNAHRAPALGPAGPAASPGNPEASPSPKELVACLETVGGYFFLARAKPLPSVGYAIWRVPWKGNGGNPEDGAFLLRDRQLCRVSYTSFLCNCSFTPKPLHSGGFNGICNH